MILYSSENMEKFVGLNPRDVIGHSLHDLVESEDDKETIRENLQPKGAKDKRVVLNPLTTKSSIQ